MNQFITPIDLLFESIRLGNMEGVRAGLENTRADRYTLLVAHMTARCYRQKEIEAFLYKLLEDCKMIATESL
jgi:hypothetical protein